MFLVTGCPRSGTSYTYEVLKKTGVLVGSEGDNIVDQELDGIVSWHHLPIVYQYRKERTKKDTAIQLRNPVKTIQSMQTLTLQSWHWMIDNICKTTGAKFTDSNLIYRASWCWYHWAQIALKVPATIYRVEDLGRYFDTLRVLTGRTSFRTDALHNENTRANQYRKFSYDEMRNLGRDWFAQCMMVALKLGYTREELESA